MMHVAPGLRAQSPLRIHRRLSDPSGFESLESGEPIDFPYDFDAVLEVVSGRYEVTQLAVSSKSADAVIGAGWLAKTPIPELRLRALNYTNIEIESKEATWDPVYANKWVGDSMSVLSRSPAMSEPWILATTYRVLRLGWRNPVTRMAEMLNVHHDTVRRWIVAAVKSEHLEPWERG